ncbi:hypothetical protein LTR08_001732 [Meristemomyces frigidus]|nr:hypothetical protein LTR08_001732 [Meristemomyces frigidus]
MAATAETAALAQWLRAHGGFLHADIHICVNAEEGVHCRAQAAIASGTTITTVPHTLALSYLNALVDDAWPLFRERRRAFGGVENIGFFYLMVQYLHRDTSFWQPYLALLPRSEDMVTPLWFDSAEDLVWLEGTDVLHTMLGRKQVYEQHYSAGIAIFQHAGVDTTALTWDLFRWAVTIFSSRAFSSRALTPQASKYWTAYKTSALGKRQTVLLDMSTAPAADLDFPVLFPVQDAPNHRFEAHVDWAFEPGRFAISVVDPAPAAAQVFNNYGSKGNDELLLGYGFCVPASAHDSIMLTLKSPPPALQPDLLRVQPGFFTREALWQTERATFRLKQPPATPSATQIFLALPEALLELLTYVLRHECSIPFAFIQHPHNYLLEDPEGQRFLPHIARALVLSLAPKLAKLQAVPLPAEARNNKQRQARIYRQGQVRILESIIGAMRTFTRSLLQPAAASGPRLVTLEGLLEFWSFKTSAEVVKPFIAGLEACSGTADVEQLRAAGWEEDTVVLLLCWIWLGNTAAQTIGDGGARNWVRQMVPGYIADAVTLSTDQDDTDAMEAADEQTEHAASLLELVRQAGEAQPGSLWEDDRWSEHLVAAFGLMLQFESLTMMVPRMGGERGEEARLVVYVHAYV